MRLPVAIFIVAFLSVILVTMLHRSRDTVTGADGAAQSAVVANSVQAAARQPAPVGPAGSTNNGNAHPLQSPEPPSAAALKASADAAAAAAEAAANIAVNN
jgi:hypothetical protein